MKLLRLTTQLRLATLLPILLTVMLFNYFYTYTTFRHAAQQHRHDNERYIKQLLPAFQFALIHQQSNTLHELIEMTERNPNLQAFSLFNADGSPLFYHGEPLTLPHDVLAAHTPTMQAHDPLLFFPIFSPALSRPPLSPLKPTLLGWIAIKIDPRPTQLVFYKHLLFGCSLSLLCLLCGWGMHVALTSNLLGAIARLQHSMRQIARQKFEAEIVSSPHSPLATIEEGCQILQKQYLDSLCDLNHHVEMATADLQQSLELLEEKNIELSIERRKTEEKIHQQSSFVANMSHEIRTPMNGILGFTNVLLETTTTPLQKEYLHTIQSSAHDLLNIINDILDYSKIQAGKLTLESIPFDLRHTIDEVMTLSTLAARQKNIELMALTEINVPKIMLGDPLRIKQILTNLVANAIKFTEHGHVRIHTRLKHQTAQHDELLLQIIDTGIGMTPEEQQHLFTAFHQADSSIFRRFGGSGLGLVVCKKLSESMQGHIHIDSQPNQGSTFSVHITLKRPPTYEADQRTIPHARPSVLYCDPHPFSRDALEQTLTFLNYQPLLLTDLNSLHTVLKENPAIQCVIFHLPTPPSTHFYAQLSQHTLPCLLLSPTPLPETLPSHCLNLLTPLPTHKLDETIHTLCIPSTKRAIPNLSLPSLRQTLKQHYLSLLVAEDNAINRQLLKTMLTPFCQLHLVNDGLAAMQACEKALYDVIILDLHMPKRTGQEAATYIRQALPAYSHTPILLISANATDITPGSLSTLQIPMCLQKPFDEEVLLQTLLTTLPPTMPPINWERCLKNMSNNLDLAQTCLTQFVEELEQNRQSFQSLFEQNDLLGLTEAAHTLKGACGFLAIEPLKQIAHHIEALPTDPAQLATLIQQLLKEMDRVTLAAVDYLSVEQA